MIKDIGRVFSLMLVSSLSLCNMEHLAIASADFSYRCFMTDSDIHGLEALFEAFAKAHDMSFRSAPLNPEGTTVAIQLDGRGTRIFSTNNDDAKEFYIDLERHGDLQQYRTNVASLNKDLLNEVAKMDTVKVEWVRLPENFPEPVPAAKRTKRGPAL